MIKIIGFSYNNDIVELSLEDNFDNFKIVWIDCFNPKDEEVYKLSKKVNIDIHDIKNVLDEQEVPRIEEDEDYYLIIYKSPLLEEEIITTSLGIFIKDNIFLTVHTDKIKAIGRLHRIIKEKKPINLFESQGVLLYNLLNEITRSYSRILLNLEDKIEYLEDSIIIGFNQKTLEEILTLRKTLIYFHKSLIGNRDVLILLKRKYIPIISKEDKENFEDLYYDTLQLIDTSSTYREFLSSIIDTAISLENIKMNQIMKILTMVTTIFAIPMWITGIFGMNFQYMPLINSPEGFWLVFGFMVMIILINGYIFKKSRWL